MSSSIGRQPTPPSPEAINARLGQLALTGRGRSSASADTSDTEPFEVSLQKPFGIGFHKNSGADAVVVHVKTGPAKEAGVVPGLKLLEIDKKVVGHMDTTEILGMLSQISTGVYTTFKFGPVTAEAAHGQQRADMRKADGYFGSFDEVAAADFRNRLEFNDLGEFSVEFKKPYGVAFGEDPADGSCLVDKTRPSCIAPLQQGDQLRKIDGVPVMGLPFNAIMDEISVIPKGVPTTFTFHREGMENKSRLQITAAPGRPEALLAQQFSPEQLAAIAAMQAGQWQQPQPSPEWQSNQPAWAVAAAQESGLGMLPGNNSGAPQMPWQPWNQNPPSDPALPPPPQSVPAASGVASAPARTSSRPTAPEHTQQPEPEVVPKKEPVLSEAGRRLQKRMKEMEEQRARLMRGHSTQNGGSAAPIRDHGGASATSTQMVANLQVVLVKPFMLQFGQESGGGVRVMTVNGVDARSKGVQEGHHLEEINGKNVDKVPYEDVMTTLQSIKDGARTLLTFYAPGSKRSIPLPPVPPPRVVGDSSSRTNKDEKKKDCIIS